MYTDAKLLVAFAIESLLVAGCATQSASSRIPVDLSDSCESHRQPLRQAEQEQHQLMVKWVAGGVAAGLVSGGACALMGGKAALCAPLGAATLLGSVVAGYMQQKSHQANNQTDLQRVIDDDSSTFSQQLGTLGTAAHRLNECRRQQIAAVSQSYRARKVDRQTAQTQLAQVETKLSEDQELVNAFLSEMDKRTDMQVKARAAAANLPPEQYIAQVESKSVRPSKEPTQKAYNINKTVQQQTRSDITTSERLLAQTKDLLG